MNVCNDLSHLVENKKSCPSYLLYVQNSVEIFQQKTHKSGLICLLIEFGLIQAKFFCSFNLRVHAAFCVN